ncbi:hypothetical protein, partial [Bacillus sp. GbtcB10]|uniref:hypothetical protein n=1 Tax=Bacillus sp. GbtcB10 TaxID=2824755 RepID=UPI001C2F8469
EKGIYSLFELNPSQTLIREECNQAETPLSQVSQYFSVRNLAQRRKGKAYNLFLLFQTRFLFFPVIQLSHISYSFSIHSKPTNISY